MIDIDRFRIWLSNSTDYSKPVINDVVSRMKRADSIVTWEPTTVYLFKLEQSEPFKRLSVSVKSQIRRAVKCYVQFIKDSTLKG